MEDALPVISRRGLLAEIALAAGLALATSAGLPLLSRHPDPFAPEVFARETLDCLVESSRSRSRSRTRTGT